jgi:hypothetical protein
MVVVVAESSSETPRAEPEAPDEFGAFPRYAAGDPLTRALLPREKGRRRRSSRDVAAKLVPRPIAIRLGAPRAVAGAPAPALASEGAPPTRAPETEHWIEFEVVDRAGKPVTGLPYRLLLPDGKEERAKLGANGRVSKERAAPGSYLFEVASIDSASWRLPG